MKPLKPLGAVILLGALGALLWGASPAPEGDSGALNSEGRGVHAGLTYTTDLSPKLEDLDGIRAAGVLRILYRSEASLSAPNPLGVSDQTTRALFVDFAEAMGVSAEFVALRSGEDPHVALAQGRGDLVAQPEIVDRAQRGILYTTPVAIAQDQVVIRDGEGPSSPRELEGRRIALRTPPHRGQGLALESLRYLEGRYGEMDLVLLPSAISHFEILRRLGEGQYDAAVVPRQVNLGFDTDALEVAFNLTGEYARAWPVRATAPRLSEALDRYLIAQLSPRGEAPVWPPAPVAERRTLRVLTRPSLHTAFVRRGRVAGFEYDLLQRFAESEGLELELVVPPSADLLTPWLKAGRGDVIANAREIPQAHPPDGAAYTHAIRGGEAVLIAAPGEAPLMSLAELRGRTLTLLAGGVGTERILAEAPPWLQVTLAPDHFVAEDLARAVAEGEVEVAVVDRAIAEATQRWGGELTIGGGVSAFDLAWAVRGYDTPLLEALNAFIVAQRRGSFYNMSERRYFAGRRWAPTWMMPGGGEGLSPYDELVRTYADLNGFDWRLVVAQMYQESRFNPTSRSAKGALGLMQILPTTAGELGVGDPDNPEEAIRGGVKYLARMRRRVAQDVPFAQRTLFALAAYNVGFGHLEDALALAGQLGLDSRRWYRHAEAAMLRLSEPRFAAGARHGYCQGKQPVHYVQQIQRRFRAYVQLHRGDPITQSLVDAAP